MLWKMFRVWYQRSPGGPQDRPLGGAPGSPAQWRTVDTRRMFDEWPRLRHRRLKVPPPALIVITVSRLLLLHFQRVLHEILPLGIN